MSHEPSCIFCKIARGEIPSARVMETSDAVVFMDINPVNPGHILLVPKSHHATLADLPDELAAAAGTLLPRLCRAVKKLTRADGLNVVVNLGRVAGQTVDHVHWHIIPRHHNDAVHWPWPHAAYGEGQLEALRGQLARELDAARE
jgi:histidine triad (HIT) family protein